MVTTLPLIVLGSKPPIIPGAIILKAPAGRFQRFLELQPKITPFLAGTLATLTGAGLITAGKVFLGTGLASGILTSARARKFAKQKVLDPTAIGIGIAGIIEEPSKLIPTDKTPAGVKEKILEIGKAAGLIGGTAAALVGGVALGKKALEKFPKPFFPKAKETPGEPPVALLPAPPSITTTTQPLGAVQQVKEPIPEAPPMQQPINITNTFNPSIKISFKKSRKFINQQLLIR